MIRIAVMGAFDTKGVELGYLRDRIAEFGVQTVTIDIGVGGDPQLQPDVSAASCLQLIGMDIGAVHRMGRNEAIQAMTAAAIEAVKRGLTEEKMDGIITICGGTGSSVCNAVYDSLPFGFPKVMLSSLPPLMGSAERLSLNDTLFLHSIVDVAGLNDIMRRQLDYAAATITAVARFAAATPMSQQGAKRRPRVALTMFGVTTPCVETVEKILLANGYDPYIFHANGDGGFQMERLMQQNFFDAVIDITLAEIMPEFFKGAACYGGPQRLKVAGKLNLPRLYVPGALDVVNYLDIPASEKYDRVFHMHTPALKVLRPNAEDSQKIGAEVGKRISIGGGPVEVVIPTEGLSQTDHAGHPCYDPEANQALFQSIRANLRPDIPVTEVHCHINDPAFGQRVAEIFMERILPL